MSEMCPYCGKEFENTKALGSHLHYRHKSNRANSGSSSAVRTASEKKKFRSLLERCLLDTGLKLPEDIEKTELALVEIPRGISPLLDQYRGPFNRALGKEKLLKEVEDLLRQKEME